MVFNSSVAVAEPLNCVAGIVNKGSQMLLGTIVAEPTGKVLLSVKKNDN